MQQLSAPSFLALAVAMMDVCIVLVCLRLVGRRMQKLHIGADDVMVVCSCVLFVAMCINAITAIAYQLWGVPLALLVKSKDYPHGVAFSETYLRSGQFSIAHELLLPVQLMFAKLSILFFYRRMLCVERRGLLHWATLVMIVITAIWGPFMFLLYIFQCGTHLSSLWNPSPEVMIEYCRMPFLEPLMLGSDLFLDLIIIILPIHRLSTLQIALRKKFLVIGVFATGCLSIMALVIRMYVTVSMLYVPTSFANINPNMRLSICLFWGVFEAGFAVIAACLPNTKFFFDRAFSKLAGTSTPKIYYDSYGSPMPSPKIKSPKISSRNSSV